MTNPKWGAGTRGVSAGNRGWIGCLHGSGEVPGDQGAYFVKM